MKIDKYWQGKVKDINNGLYIVYNEKLSLLEVRHKDERSGMDRSVLYVQDEEGKPTELNLGVLRHLKYAVDWDLVGEFPDPEKMYQELMRQHNLAKSKKELERRGFVLDFNREHSKEWKGILENWRDNLPRSTVNRLMAKEDMRKKKIII